MSSYKSFVINGKSAGAFVEEIHLGLCDSARSPYCTCEQCETHPANDRCKRAPWVGICYRDGQAYDAHTSTSDRVIWYLGKELSPQEVENYKNNCQMFNQAAEEMYARRERHYVSFHKATRKWKLSEGTRNHLRSSK